MLTLFRIAALPLSLVIASIQMASASTATSPAVLAKSRNCMACHQTSGQALGPGFVQVARKYEGVPDAGVVLQKKILTGGAGAWGNVPMPANPHLTPEEALILANWILSK